MIRTLSLTLAACMLLTGVAVADVSLCLGNGTYKCYETDLTCADITIGPIIQACENPVVGPGGGGGSGGVITDLHPELDFQGITGPTGGFGGSVFVGADQLVEFTLIFESRDTFAPGRRMQAVARATTGKIYYAQFDADVLDPDSDNDNLIAATAGGQEILGAFDREPLGAAATGDVTVTVFIIDPDVKTTILSTHHTPINFGDLEWNFLADGPVGNTSMSWGAVKAGY
ncbi:hypothetical protein KKG45_00265 [bacterium]|nr:hypothetical protein [bacterium]MBU1071657.1 hypothetical protein [bacterium]MBU1676130.1 hypothetical protein [bacterium]